MSRQPPNNNNTDSFDNDLQAIEQAMNNMMQGAFGMLFKEFMGSSSGDSIFDQPPGGMTTTTIFDGRNINQRRGGVVEEVIEDDEFGGNDFKQLANKRKQNRLHGGDEKSSSSSGVVVEESKSTPASEIVRNNTITSKNEIMSDFDKTASAAAGSIFNLLFHNTADVLFNREYPPSSVNQDFVIQTPNNEVHSNNNNNSNWLFTSTSQRTTYQPDGTQETIITKKTNGVTETIRQTRYPDGRTEESRETQHGNSLWNRLLGRS